jgi:multiple sugar transport system substrate-binding protein
MKGFRFSLTLIIALSFLLAACGGGAAANPTASAPTQPLSSVATTAPVEAPTNAPTAAQAATSVSTEAVAPTAAPTGAPASSSGPVTLSIVCRCVTGGTNDQTVQWITQFVIPKFQEQEKAAGKDVTVNLVQFGGSDEELKARYALDLKSGAGSDLMAFDGFWTPEFVAGGLIKPLSDIVGPDWQNWEGWSHIPKTIQQLLSYQDKVYGIPLGTDARAIWYRKDIFKDAGLPDNWQPTSWQDILDAAAKIKQAKPDVTPLQINAGTAMGEATTLQGWYMVFLGTGNDVYDFTSNKYPNKGQGYLDALNFYKTIYIDKKLGDARLQLLKDGRDRSFLEFRDGKIAMLVEGDYFWRSVLASGSTKLDNRDQLVGWAKMPADQPGKGIKGQDFVTASGGTGYTLNPNTKNPAEAWALMTFMFSKDSLDNFQTIQPTIKSRDDVPVPNDPVLTALAKELLPITTIRPSDPNYSTVVSPAIQLMTERIVSGAMTPQQAMDEYANTLSSKVGADKVEDAK